MRQDFPGSAAARSPRGGEEAAAEVDRLRRREAALEAEVIRLRGEIPAAGTGDRRYHAILESAVDFAIVATDRDGVVNEWNTGAERIFGWSAGEMLGEPADRFFTPEDRAEGRPYLEMRLALDSGRAADDRWHLRKDGTRFWASGEMMPLMAADGSHLGFLKILRDRTEERRVVIAQREDAEFLRSVLASSGDCIKVLDLDANLVFMSEGGQRVMEVDDFESIRGCPWFEFWHGEGRNDALRAVAAAKAGGVGQFQGAAPTLAGTPRWWDVRVTPILGADGRPEKLLSVSRDITADRRAEDALREAQGLNTPILNSSRDCIVVLDLDGHNLFVSPGGIASMEIEDVDAILGLSWLRVWKGDDHAAARAAVAEARAGGTGRFQGFCPTHKGTPKWWDVQISPLPGPDGQPERLVSVGRDITADKRAEDQLRRLNDTLEQRVAERTRERDRTWSKSQDLLAVLDTAGRFRAVNPAWATVLGWRADEVVGRDYLDFIHPEDHPASGDALVTASAGDLPAFENRYRHKDGGYRWLSWVAAPEEDLIYASGRHVTVEKEAAIELAAVQEQLRQSQKMEAVGQLTGGLAHDFNNLLTGIAGSLEMLQTRVAQGRLTDVDRYVAAAQGAAKRAAALTHRLLAFSRRQALDPRPTDMNRLIAGMEELIRRTVGPSVAVEAVGAAGLWLALVDPNQLENALLNLCINARDAMPEGGRLTIETANKWLDGRAARERDLPPGQYLSLSVTDTGTGMTPDVVKRAFDPFFTTKPIGQGTGLGLSMIYGFARQSGGQVRAYSEVGHGTTMCLYLPRHQGVGGEPEDTLAPAEAARAEAGETVLVVDDEPTVRMLVIEVLEALGYVAIEAADGAAGLKILQSKARVDLLVTDVGLPGGLNGRQLADGARAVRPNLKVLFITGYAENAVLGSGSLAPGMEVLTKPFGLDALASRIKVLLARA